ncbi:MAG: hypothetical protein IJ213_02890 [Bacteroidales bacterium]|nr:hypothetical protein [Bacteroidales bacterium]MBQ9311973.1 hypothetical protein [Bacteroidales bacterium]
MRKNISSGYKTVDNIVKNWNDANIIVLAERWTDRKKIFSISLAEIWTERKTIFSISLAKKLSVNQNISTAYFSMDKPIRDKIISNITELDIKKILDNTLDKTETIKYQQGFNTLNNSPLYIDETKLNLYEFSSKVRQMVKEKGVEVVFLDHLQVTDDESIDFKASKSVFHSLRELAKELNICIFISALLPDREKRSPRVPCLANLNKYEKLDKQADIILFLFELEYYSIEEERPKIFFKVAKNLSAPNDRFSMYIEQFYNCVYDIEGYPKSMDNILL